ncbi:hypothetical protein [Thermococcus sp.]|uniref:hypothetical protein n=1 Tax=Thermococcus sp. TaxID=35749 RepID=UPI0025D17E62|nr:hypothetical protein [Thermococcus sp.]
MKKFYARVGDEEYLLLDNSFEDAVVTFWLWNAMRAEKGELQPGARARVMELALAYQQGIIENAEISLLQVLHGDELRNELRAYFPRPVKQATLNGLMKVVG